MAEKHGHLIEALKHYACACEPGHCAMSADDDDTPVDEMLCGRIARDAIARASNHEGDGA